MSAERAEGHVCCRDAPQPVGHAVGQIESGTMSGPELLQGMIAREALQYVIKPVSEEGAGSPLTVSDKGVGGCIPMQTRFC